MPALGALLISAPGLAQQPPTAGRVLESVREQVPPPAKPEEQILEKQPEVVRPIAPESAARTVRVTGFRVQGNTVYDEPTLLAVLAPYIGKDLNFDGLREAAEAIKIHYRDRQYFLAQAFLPAQQIRDGVVTIQVLEGKLGKAGVRMTDKARLKESVASGMLDAQLPAGAHITETSLEKPLLLINDLPGVIVRSTLKPGAVVGEADLEVTVDDEGRLFDGYVELDNMGNDSSGEFRLGVTVNGRNLTGYGDLLTIRGLVAESNGTTLGRLSYTLPVGPYGTKVTASYSNLTYELSETFADLGADGDADVYSVFAQHPLIRSRNNNLFLLVGFDRKDLVDRQFDGASEEERRLDNFLVALRGDFRDDLAGGGLNSYSAMITSGDLENREVSTDPYETEGRFAKLNIEYRRLQNLAAHTTLLLSASGQTANGNLTSAEQMSLGGPYGVRSHPVGEGSGDDAIMGTIELRRVLPGVKPLGGTLQLKAFYDLGYVKGHHDPLPSDTDNSRRLYGYGVGVNLAKRGDFLFALDLAFRTGEQSLDDNQSARVWAQAIKWF
jgi:hemolysin activation/secretion protein